MAVLNNLAGIRLAVLGEKVSSAAKAIPVGAAEALFTVTGGKVMITSLVGRVTQAIANVANNTKIVGNPTVGTDVDLCAVLNIANDEIGTLYGITGLNTDAMIGVNAGGLPGQVRPVIINEGTLDLSCANTTAGAGICTWDMTYLPIDDGASVSAA